jgi:hypothetical protein
MIPAVRAAMLAAAAGNGAMDTSVAAAALAANGEEHSSGR